MRSNAERDKGGGSEWHGDEQLDLVVKLAAVVEISCHEEQGGARQDTKNLASWLPVQRQHDRNHRAIVDGKANQQRHGTLVQLTSVRQVNHTDAEGKPSHRSCQAKGSGQSNNERQHSSKHGHLSVSISSREAETRFWSLEETYQSTVRWRPCMNVLLGSQPRSFLAKELSATRL